METTKLKRFATEARVNLMEGVKRKLRLLGFDERGHAISEPQLVQGATLWKGEEYPEDFYNQWKALQQRLSEKGLREVAEEAAYTWFNRMIAIRILSMNGFCEPILRIDPSTGLPNLLVNARMGRIPEMTIYQKNRFEVLMDDDTKSYEQFALLLTAWCHDNPIINACFGSINDYVELLLQDNILRPDGFLSLLNETDFISEEDYKSAELIGWLYQFYISDRKDEVFAKKGKVEAEEIPAATQIFTPNWIVKYMVQNTILPQVDAPEEIFDKAKYLVKVEGDDNRKVELEDLKVADFACGSGHILNECFDLLFELYRSEAYSRKEAVEYIFTKNLTGIDIDLRAKQLATFALLLKACQKDESFIDAHCLPNVLNFPEVDRYDWRDTGGHFACAYQIDYPEGYSYQEIDDAFNLLKDSNSLGSIIKFNISSGTRKFIKDCITAFDANPLYTKEFLPLVEGFKIIIALSDFYDAIVMNPPYMPTSKVEGLKEYTAKNYPDSKTDLFSVFMDVCWNRLKDGGKYGMINMQSWMFLSSFESLRKKIIEKQQIDSLLHLGPRTFDELSGEVVQNTAFVITKGKREVEGIYYRLINGKSCKAKEEMFLHLDSRYKINQKQFEQIPGNPLAYWVSKNMIRCLTYPQLKNFGNSSKGIITGNNSKFIRNWFEVNKNEINFKAESNEDTSVLKWYPLKKGGSFRRWYGNLEHVINWKNKGYDILGLAEREGRNKQDYSDNFKFKPSISWSDISSGGISFRYSKNDLSESAGMCFFPSKIDDLLYILGFLNSSIATKVLSITNPTIHCTAGNVEKMPLLYKNDRITTNLIKDCISISKKDWDAHETSWDYQTNELIRIIKEDLKIKNIEDTIKEYKIYWSEKFFQLHKNEEELNRQFIEIYGLQDELNPHVEYEDITILQNGEISLYRPTHSIDMYYFSEDEKETYNKSGGIIEGDMVLAYQSLLSWNEDIIIKQLISYIVGLYMGRYRLDKPGLNIAYPDPSDEDLATYDFSITHNETMTIDPDAIIPVLPKDAPFYDNLYNYVVEFIGKVWGQDDLTKNLNFIEKALGKSLEDYLLKDFWKDHKKMYQNRPIYWEFASKKGAFKAIIYAHRMDKYTIEVLRSKYVLPFIKHIENKISNLESREQELSTKERRELDNLRTKILPELEEYHSRVEQIAAETAARPQVFDLDDGIPHNHSLFGDIVTKLK